MNTPEENKEPSNIYIAREKLKSGIKFPYSGTPSDDLFHQITNGVLFELSGRSGIGNELEGCDQQVREEITNAIADIIHVGITDHITNNFFKDDETGNMKILSITDAKQELEELFTRNMIKAVTD